MDIEAKIAELDARQKTSEHRIKDLETEMRDLHKLTEAVAVTNTNVQQLTKRVDEMHTDIKGLRSIPGKRWNAAVEWIVKGSVGAIVGAIFALLLK